MSQQRENNAYILGTELAELHRLGLQHQVWAGEARQGWENGGFTDSMTILDLGSGPGFCSRELATLVGPKGQLIALDKSQAYLDYINKINESQQLNIETRLQDFDEMTLESNSLDGMYCRWALAWIPNPKEILAKVHTAMKTGGKVVIHEYYSWMTHQINPPRPILQKAISSSFQSFEDAEGNINIGKELPSLLSELGFKVIATRPMSKLTRPNELTWQWPRTFYNVYWPKVKEMGYLTNEELTQAFEELETVEQNPNSTLLCPLLIEIIAEKL